MSKALRLISAGLVFTTTLMFGVRLDVCAEVTSQSNSSSLLPSASRMLTFPAERLENKTDHIQQIVTKWKVAGINRYERDEVIKLQNSLDLLKASIEQDLTQRELELRGKPYEAKLLPRHKKFVQSYRARFSELKSTLRGIAQTSLESSAIQAKAERLNTLLNPVAASGTETMDVQLPRRQATALSADELVLNIGTAETTPKISVDPLAGSGNAIEIQQEEAVKSSVTRLDAPPVPGDTTQTIDTEFSAAVTIPANLNNIVAVYEYVLNQIKYEPYNGSVKGAERTFLEGAGNDVDQASLLIGLLRRINIPARYVKGIVELPVDAAKNLVGVDEPAQIASAFIKNGIPVQEIKTAGGEINAVQIDRVWVRARTNYLPYRSGTQGMNPVWIDLDPSFKTHLFGTNKNVTREIGVDPATFLAQIKLLGNAEQTIPNHYVANLPHEFILTKLNDEWGPRLQNYLTLNNLTMASIFRTAEIKEELFGKLPASLPYQVIQEQNSYSEFPDSERYKIRFRLVDPVSSTEIFSREEPLVALANKTICLSYQPATPADETYLAEHLASPVLDAFQIQLKPELNIAGNGTPVSITGPATGMGNSQTLEIDFISPGGASETSQKTVNAGSFYVLTLDLQTINEAILNQHKVLLETARQNSDSKAILTETLQLAGLNYFYQIDRLNTVSAGSLDVMITRQPSLTVASYEMKFDYLIGLPFRAQADGIYLDTVRDVYVPVSVQGRRDAETQFMITSALSGSSAVHVSLEQLFQGSGLSSARLIEEANQTGMPIYSVDSTNLLQVLPNLSALPAGVLTRIENACHANYKVTVPETPVALSPYNESTFVMIDPVTGNSSFYLESGTNGGKVELDFLKPADILGNGTVTNHLNLSNGIGAWMNVLKDSGLNVSYGYLPAAASMNDWFKETTNIDEAAVVSSILAVSELIRTVSLKPMVSNVTVQNDFFSPKDPNDCASLGLADIATHNECMGIEYSVTPGAVSSVTIKNSSGQTVKTFTNLTGALSHIIWDGKSDSAALVLDGSYTYEIDAVKNTIPAEQKTGTIVVDKQAPTANITSPSTITAGDVFIKGTAFDEANFDYYQIQIVKDLDFAHPLLDESYLNAVETENALALWNVASPATPTSGYQAILTVYDKAKNATTVILDFTLDKFKTIQFLAPKVPNTTFSRFVDTTIQINDSTITQMQLKAGTKTISLPWSTISRGTYSFQWSPAQEGVAPGPYTLTVIGKNAGGTQVGDSDSVGIIIENFSAPVQIVSATVTPQEFDPTVGSPVQINAQLNGLSNWRITIHKRPTNDGLPLNTVVYDSGTVQNSDHPIASWDGKINATGPLVTPGQTLDGYIWYMKKPAANIDDPDNRFFWFWFTIYIKIPASSPDDPLLTATITSPQNGDQLENAKIALLGKVTDGEDSSVLTEILIKPSESSEWIIASSEQVETGKLQAKLGTLNAMTLADDVYDVMARVTDSGNHVAYSPLMSYSIFSGLKIGNFVRTFVDHKTNVNNFPITISRTYDSQKCTTQGSFGYGWSESIQEMQIIKDGKYDKIVTTPDGTKERFVWEPKPTESKFGGGTSKIKNSNFVNANGRSGNQLYLDYGSQAPQVVQDDVTGDWFDLEFHPIDRTGLERFTLVTRDRAKYKFDASGNLISIKSPSENGLEILLDNQGISKQDTTRDLVVQIDRDTQNRITEIRHGNTLIQYEYYTADGPSGSIGDLHFVKTNYDPLATDGHGHPAPKGKIAEYIYGDGITIAKHYLIKILKQAGWDGTNPVMSEEMRMDYDAESNMLKAISNENGRTINMEHATGNGEEITTDLAQRKHTKAYDSHGLLTSDCNSLNQCTLYTYDKYGNRITETDPMGAVTTYEYGQMFWAQDLLGGTYSGFTREELYKQLDPNVLYIHGYRFWNAWNGIADPTKITKPSGGILSFTYNKQGQLLQQFSNLGSMAHTNEYDNAGRLISDGNVKYEYSSLQGEDSLIDTVTDLQTGKITKMDYHQSTPTIPDPADGLPSKIYSNFGETLEHVEMDYTPDGLLQTQTSYDASGTQINGSTIEANYDSLGNLTSLKEASKNPGWTLTPDNNLEQLGKLQPDGTLAPQITIHYCKVNTPEYCVDPQMSNPYEINKPKIILYHDPNSPVLEERYTYDATTESKLTVLRDDTPADPNDHSMLSVKNIEGFEIYKEITNDTAKTKIQNIPDELGQLKEVYLNGTIAEKHAYDDNGREIAFFDYVKNRTTTFDYDPATGLLLSKLDPDEGQIDYTYYSDGRLESITDKNGATTYEYDGSGRLIKTIQNDGSLVTSTYNGNGLLLAGADENRNEIRYDFDPNSRLKTIYQDPSPFKAPGGQTRVDMTSYSYPSPTAYTRTDFTSPTDPIGHRMTYESAPASPPNARRKITLHSAGAGGDKNKIYFKTITLSTPQPVPSLPGWAPNPSATYKYLEEIENFGGDRIKTYYDQNNKQIGKYVEAGDRWTLFDYDTSSPEYTLINAYTGETSGTATLIKKKLNTSTNLFDSIMYPNNRTINYQYENGRVLETQILNNTTPIYHVTYTYDPSSGKINQIHDLLSGMTVNDQYASDGRKLWEEYGNNRKTTYTYDGRKRIDTITTADKTTGDMKRMLKYDYTPTSLIQKLRIYENGNFSTPVNTFEYTYDLLGRLTSEKRNSVPTFSYTYYLNGARKTMTEEQTGITHTYDYNDIDELEREELSDGTIYDFIHDANGNLTEKRKRNIPGGGYTTLEVYSYDGENHLLSAEFPETGEIILYSYTPEGDRFSRQIGAQKTDLIIDPIAYSSPQVLIEYNGSVQNLYFHGSDGPAAINQNGNEYYLHPGQTQNTMFTTDLSGNVIQDYAYTGFGNPLNKSGQPLTNFSNPYLATGEYYEGTSKLYDHRTRMYSPERGQFQSRDSYDRPLTDIKNIPYGFNQPLNFRDPTGHSLMERLAVIAIQTNWAVVGMNAQITTLFAIQWFWETRSLPWYEQVAGFVAAMAIGYAIGYVIVAVFGSLWFLCGAIVEIQDIVVATIRRRGAIFWGKLFQKTAGKTAANAGEAETAVLFQSMQTAPFTETLTLPSTISAEEAHVLLLQAYGPSPAAKTVHIEFKNFLYKEMQAVESDFINHTAPVRQFLDRDLMEVPAILSQSSKAADQVMKNYAEASAAGKSANTVGAGPYGWWESTPNALSLGQDIPTGGTLTSGHWNRLTLNDMRLWLLKKTQGEQAAAVAVRELEAHELAHGTIQNLANQWILTDINGYIANLGSGQTLARYQMEDLACYIYGLRYVKNKYGNQLSNSNLYGEFDLESLHVAQRILSTVKSESTVFSQYLDMLKITRAEIDDLANFFSEILKARAAG